MFSGDASLVLASGSPRRRALLEQVGLEAFAVRPPDVDESPHADESPQALVERLARAKASADVRPGEVVLAADTVVVLDGRILGKPTDPADAKGMLTQLSDRSHTVLTGVALARRRDSGALALAASFEETTVVFARLSPEEIRAYVAGGEPMDKAGAYAIQGHGSLFVERLEGNYSNVVGLPLPLVRRLGRELGWDPFLNLRT